MGEYCLHESKWEAPLVPLNIIAIDPVLFKQASVDDSVSHDHLRGKARRVKLLSSRSLQNPRPSPLRAL